MRLIVLPMALMLANGAAFSQSPNNQKKETRVIIRDGNLSTEKPLVIIDGKSGGDLQSLSPDNILKMDVLKGNSAYQMYGDEGKNGVVVITTKKGPSVDSLPTGTKKVERIVTVNTIRKSDGGKDTTIIRADSMTVQVDGERIVINGMPLDMPQGAIVKDLAIPRVEGLDGKLFFFDREIDMNRDRKSAPKVGVTVQDVEDGKGVKVLSVVSTGAAAKAGVLADDRIVAIDDKVVNDVDALKDAIEKGRDKRSIMIHLQRGKKDMHLELVFPRELKKAEL